MNLILHTFKSTRVLKEVGGKWSAQENIDAAKFNAALNDDSNTITNYEETQAYSDAVAASEQSDKLAQIQILEASALRSVIAVALDPSNQTERGYLQDKKGQIDAIRATL